MVCKEEDDPITAKTEFLGQALRRAFLPAQTEHLIGHHPTTDVYYVLSKYVEGFSLLNKEEFSDLNYGKVAHDLGQINILDIWLMDNDAKDGNVGWIKSATTDNGLAIRLDGDQSFAEIQDEFEIPANAFAITKSLLTSLPHPGNHYKPYNWLEFTHERKTIAESDAVSVSLNNNKLYKSELYKMLYKIIITPDIFLENMVDACFASGGERYLEMLKQRRYTLGIEALKIEEFKEYIKSDAAEVAKKAHVSNLNNFIINNEFELVPPQDKNMLSNNLESISFLLISQARIAPLTPTTTPLFSPFKPFTGTCTMLPDFTQIQMQAPNRAEKAPTEFATAGQKRCQKGHYQFDVFRPASPQPSESKKRRFNEIEELSK